MDEIYQGKINEIAGLVGKLGGQGDDTELLQEIEELCRETRIHLEGLVSGWFISVNFYGPYDDYIKVYRPLGYMALDKARDICLGMSDPNSWNEDDDDVMEADKPIFDKFVTLAGWSTMLCNAQYLRAYGDELPGYIDGIEDRISSIRDELGLTRKWEKVWLRQGLESQQ